MTYSRLFLYFIAVCILTDFLQTLFYMAVRVKVKRLDHISQDILIAIALTILKGLHL